MRIIARGRYEEDVDVLLGLTDAQDKLTRAKKNYLTTLFVRMYHHLSQYAPEKGAFSTWMFRIAQNVLNRHMNFF